MTTPPSPFGNLKHLAEQGDATRRAKGVSDALRAIHELQTWLRRTVLALPGEAATARTVGDLRRALDGLQGDVPLDAAVVVDRHGGGVALRRADEG